MYFQVRHYMMKMACGNDQMKYIAFQKKHYSRKMSLIQLNKTYPVPIQFANILKIYVSCRFRTNKDQVYKVHKNAL